MRCHLIVQNLEVYLLLAGSGGGLGAGSGGGGGDCGGSGAKCGGSDGGLRPGEWLKLNFIDQI